MLGAGCLQGDAALKHEGRDGILCFCVSQLMCVRGDGVRTELLPSAEPMLPSAWALGQTPL